MSKKILLIYPKAGFEAEHVNIYMPMGLMSIASPLVKMGYEVIILDQRIENNFYSKLKECLDEDLICVGITSMTGTQILYALEIANFIREQIKVPIVWGGVHSTLTAEQAILNKNVDVVVRGEGDVTFKELVCVLDSNKSLKTVKGITWKDRNDIFYNPDREFCNLDELPRASYELLDIERYLVPQVAGKTRCLNVYASRGCPRQCTFCYNTKFNKSRYRTRDIDRVLEEVEWLVKKYDLDSICINDDNFSVDIQRTHYFCRELIKRKIVSAWAAKGMEICRLEKMDFNLLQESGCRHIYMGIESGSEKILRFLKRQDTVESIKKVVRKFAETEIVPHYNFIMGSPIEGQKELYESMDMVDYIRKIDPKAHCSSFHIVIPFPGTELFNIAVEKYGFVPPDNLEDWYNFRWECVKVPWISPKMRIVYSNICLITYFNDEKFSNKLKNNLLLKYFANIFGFFAKVRWKHRSFRFCPEFRLLNWLTNYRVIRKIKKVKSNNMDSGLKQYKNRIALEKA